MNWNEKERLDTYELNFILNDKKYNRHINLTHGIELKNIKCNRLEVYKKSTKCVKCGLKASFFALEKDKKINTNKYHINLYGIKDNIEVIFTKDHIIPKSYGGENNINNYNTMCIYCNQEKANNIIERGLKYE